MEVTEGRKNWTCHPCHVVPLLHWSSSSCCQFRDSFCLAFHSLMPLLNSIMAITSCWDRQKNETDICSLSAPPSFVVDLLSRPFHSIMPLYVLHLCKKADILDILLFRHAREHPLNLQLRAASIRSRHSGRDNATPSSWRSMTLCLFSKRLWEWLAVRVFICSA